jgi:uncharacterized integral membrane protein
MRIKTIIIIVITILLTVVLMQNTERDSLYFLWATFRMSKLLILAIVAIIAFILGYLVGRPKRVKLLGGDLPDSDQDKNNSNTLSEEDKDYIS